MKSTYYDPEVVRKLQAELSNVEALNTYRRFPRPWPMFCGVSLDNRELHINVPVMFDHVVDATGWTLKQPIVQKLHS